ncbi:Uncharacterised protein [Vibrio cholerae]|nr:Uncharacterised protein [Vibrio cholerae]
MILFQKLMRLSCVTQSKTQRVNSLADLIFVT